MINFLKKRIQILNNKLRIVLKESNNIDEAMTGAFVDGQLDAANCEAIIEAMEEDNDLRDRVYDLRKIKELVKLSFGDISPPKTSPGSFTNPLRSQCISSNN
jgi:hypothetical protein